MSTFELWSLIGIYFTGIATFSAAGIALYIAHRGEKVGLRILAGLRVLMDELNSSDIVWIEITNVRPRLTVVTGVSCRISRLNGTYTYAVPSPAAIAGRIPASLQDGQSVTLTLQLEWLKNLAKQLADKIPEGELKVAINSVMIVANTSSGKTFLEKPEQPIIDHLYEEAVKCVPPRN
jgi:hypothetical protein